VLLFHAMAQIWRSLFALAREIFTWERLPVDEPKGRARSERRSLLSLLFAPEPLPFDPHRPRRGSASWLRWIFFPEPIVPEPPPPGPAHSRRRRASWLRWLLAPERIDEQ